MQGLQQRTEILLHPGQHAVADEHCVITTLLGSCVSITLWHRARRIGAMSHFLLASRGAGKPNRLDGRYGDEAISLMVQKLARHHIAAVECEAKIFGGGNMFPGQQRPTPLDVGKRNGESARKLLQQLGIKVVSESLFGVGHRKIIFDVATGDVWSRQQAPYHHVKDAST